jgi:NADH:ubiquinone oxidoreductase subunit 2 (subunit N)
LDKPVVVPGQRHRVFTDPPPYKVAGEVGEVGIVAPSPNLYDSRDGGIYMEVIALITAAVLLNVIGYIAWKRGALGQGYRAAVVVATLALLLGARYNHWVLTFGAALALLLGLYAFVAWVRHRKGLQPGIHRLGSHRGSRR